LSLMAATDTYTGTPREQVLTAMRGGDPGRVPAGICLGGSWPISQSNASLQHLIGDAVTTARIFYDVHESVDADLIMVGTGATALLCRALGSEIKFSTRGAPDIVSEPVASEADIQILSVKSALADESVVWLRDVAAELVKLNNSKRAIFASGRAPFSLAAHLCGLEKLSRSFYKDKSFAVALLEFTTELSIGYFKLMLSVDGVDGAFIADPTASGDVISARHYENYALPYLKKVIEEVESLGKVSMLHICGDITDRLELITRSGVNSVSLDYKVNLSKAREIVGNTVCLAGNVNPVDILQFGSEDDVKSTSNACLNDLASGGGFILLPGCDIASGVSATNISAFVETAHSWKKRRNSDGYK